MITFIGWAVIVYVVFLLTTKILFAPQDKDRSWYEEPIFKQDGTVSDLNNEG